VRHELAAGEIRLLRLLFPHLAGLDLDHVRDLGDAVRVVARTGTASLACRGCGAISVQVHDRCRPRLQDLACGGRPVQVVPGREADTFADWLRGHPGIAVICRDRAGACARVGRAAALAAVQAIGRFRPWQNRAGAVDKAVPACLGVPDPPSTARRTRSWQRPRPGRRSR
jgi:transposase